MGNVNFKTSSRKRDVYYARGSYDYHYHSKNYRKKNFFLSTSNKIKIYKNGRLVS